MRNIDGLTRVFGIIADPIKQVKTPQAMNEVIADRGANAVFVPFHARQCDLSAFVAGLKTWQNLPGFTLTIPHKEGAMRLCDRLGPMATVTGAVNVVRKGKDGEWEGETFDGVGFVNGLKGQGIDPKGARIFIQGAGGAAKAIATALADTGASSVGVCNRSSEKANQLVSRINHFYPGTCRLAAQSEVQSFDIVINATSLGLNDADAMPIDISLLSAKHIVAEVIMNPDVTRFLHAAADKGCTTHRGIHMLKCQISEIANYLGM